MLFRGGSGGRPVGKLFYRPDLEYWETGGRRVLVEYERYQTLRYGWSHIERFVGFAATCVSPFEKLVLRFVCASQKRAELYTRLVTGFGEYLVENPQVRPPTRCRVEVSSLPALVAASDPSDPGLWDSVDLPKSPTPASARPVMHPFRLSPYKRYVR